jgi:hypothetical protein
MVKMWKPEEEMGRVINEAQTGYCLILGREEEAI